jgi:hypothetical protein
MWEKHGISKQNRKENIYDTSMFRLPRHASFTINHTFAKLGKTGQNVPESIENTTV